jgi:hypothetical protein
LALSNFREDFCSGGSSGRLALLETLPAVHWTALCGFERNGRFPLAPGTDCLGFYPLSAAATLREAKRLGALALAVLAAFRLIFELFVVEEKLFPCGKDEIASAVYTLENLILELHSNCPLSRSPQGGRREKTLIHPEP